MDELFCNNFLQCSSSTNRLFFTSRYVCLLFPVISSLAHMVRVTICKEKKPRAHSLFPTIRVAVLWDRNRGLLRFRLPCFRRQQNHLFLLFFQVLPLTFTNICPQYDVFLLEKFTYAHSDSQNLQLQNSYCFLGYF